MAELIHGCEVDIESNAARKFLRDAAMRIVEYEGGPPWYTRTVKLTRAEVYHDGRWKYLARTDLCDDVCTTYDANYTLDQWRKYYVNAAHLGARINDERFAVIDSVSDG